MKFPNIFKSEATEPPKEQVGKELGNLKANIRGRVAREKSDEMPPKFKNDQEKKLFAVMEAVFVTTAINHNKPNTTSEGKEEKLAAALFIEKKLSYTQSQSAESVGLKRAYISSRTHQDITLYQEKIMSDLQDNFKKIYTRPTPDFSPVTKSKPKTITVKSKV